LHDKRKTEDLERLRERRKRLRLSTQPLASAAEDQEHEEEHDDDFVPDGEGSGHDDGAAGDDDVALAAAGDGDKGKSKVQSKRCSPTKFIKLLNALPDDLKGQVVAKEFGGLLNFKPNYLKRDVSSWLMRKFNPEIMKLEIGGGKEINVSDHAVWCAMQIPNAGGDPLSMSDADARAERDRLGLQIVGPSYNSRRGITLKQIIAGLKNLSLTGELGLRAFFMGAFQCLLFSNTDTKIRLDDVRYTQDIQNIGTRNWCKAVVDRLSVAARLYKLDYAQKGINAPISGCTIFLVVSSSHISIFPVLSFLFFATVCIYWSNHLFVTVAPVIARSLQLVFVLPVFHSFFLFLDFADVICRQLAARIPDKPFFHPPVFFSGLEDDSSYNQRGTQGRCHW
jgi:hypothetical protein